MGSVILFFLVFRGFWILRHGFCHFGFSKFLIPFRRENRVICMARDGCISYTGMYSSADGCIYGLCWPENSEKKRTATISYFDLIILLILIYNINLFSYISIYFEN